VAGIMERVNIKITEIIQITWLKKLLIYFSSFQKGNNLKLTMLIKELYVTIYKK
jgi:hypothetical protein